MGTHGNPWVPMGTHGYPWIPMGTHEYAWVPMGTHGYPWVRMGTHGYPWVCIWIVKEHAYHKHIIGPSDYPPRKKQKQTQGACTRHNYHHLPGALVVVLPPSPRGDGGLNMYVTIIFNIRVPFCSVCKEVFKFWTT